jgi:hypothetical protein
MSKDEELLAAKTSQKVDNAVCWPEKDVATVFTVTHM